jgi:hypothetical protein
MAHAEIRSLAAYVHVDVLRLMSMIESSSDFDDFYVQVKEVAPYIQAWDCKGAWARYWELYSQS